MVASTRRSAKKQTILPNQEEVPQQQPLIGEAAEATTTPIIKQEEETDSMPTPSMALRTSPPSAAAAAAGGSTKLPSPPIMEESEDERQYMMLRHSDDEATNGNNGGNSEEAVAVKGEDVAEAADSHVIPKSPDRFAPSTGGALRSVSMRGRSSGGVVAGSAPSTVTRQVTQPPVPFRVGGPALFHPPSQPPPPHYYGGPPPYMRGVSEDAGLAQHQHAAPYPPPAEGHHHEQYYDPNFSLSVALAPSWGDIDIRQGTFDYGEAAVAGMPPGEHHYQPQHGTNVITPAQTIRKNASQAPTLPATYMYPPSSPIKAGPSPKASPESSPRLTASPKVEPESDEELAAAWMPPKGNSTRRTHPTGSGTTERVVEAKDVPAVHVPPPPTTTPGAPPADGVLRGPVQPQFIRRQPSHAPPSSGGANTTTGSTPPRYRPPLVVDSSRSADSSESPGHSLQGGRVQLVGGGIGESGTPWNLVSRSRSTEESAGGSISAGGSNMNMNDWEPPPRPDRRPMVPPPGRPANNGASPPRVGVSQYPPEYMRGHGPPPPEPRPYYQGYEYYYQGAPPPSHPSPIKRSPSSHNSGPPPPTFSPERYPGYPYPYPHPPHPSQYHQQYAHPYPPGQPPPPQPNKHHEEVEDDEAVHPLLKDYNPHRDGVRPQFTNVKKSKESMANKRAVVMNTVGGTCAVVGLNGNLVPAGGVSPKRRRRRNPNEKAAAAAAMAAAAAAAMKERRIHEAAQKRTMEQDDIGDKAANREVPSPAAVNLPRVAVVAGAAVPFSEEELKTLGSGDDEDIPAAKRAAMASAVALRAAAGGSPVEPPKSASEVDFDIADPPMGPVCPPSVHPVLESATLMTENDVLCGRGGGTNSQMGNRRFRALVRDFQPTYLMAKRREKPKMARSVVLIVRNRSGRFLRRDDSDGRLYEVGDDKAEAKTCQALREGLDVRATKTAANTLMGTSGGGEPNKKRKTSPVSSERAKSKAAPEAGRTTVLSVTRPKPIHAPAARPTRPPPVDPRAQAGHQGYYQGYPYAPQYEDPNYYRAAEYGYGQPGSHPLYPPTPSSARQHHYHYPGHSSASAHYPTHPYQYSGYPGYGPPSPPRSAVPRPPHRHPTTTSIPSRPKTSTLV